MSERKKRRDIDKETMFNKIMPTHLLDPDGDDDDDIRAETVQRVLSKPVADDEDDYNEPQPAPAPAEPAPQVTIQEPAPAPQPAPAPVQEKQESIDDLLQDLQTARLEHNAPLANADLPRYINLTEMMVLERLSGMLDKFKCCKCEACRQMIVLHALNTLAPNYLFATEAAAKDTISRMDASAVISCLIQAIMKTRTNPPHPIITT